MCTVSPVTTNFRGSCVSRGAVTVRLHDGYASISPVTDQSEHSIQISIEQILISIERSARYLLVLVPVDGHTVLGYRTSAVAAGGKRAAWLRETRLMDGSAQ